LASVIMSMCGGVLCVEGRAIEMPLTWLSAALPNDEGS
jgi:hypothetical protein